MSELAKMNKNRMIWVDLETTGLDHETGQILEVAVLITDSHLHELIRRSWQVGVPEELRQLKRLCDDYVTEMHERSGLFKEIAEGFGHQLAEVQDHLQYLIEDFDAVNAPLCGSSVHFDRKWLERHMPSVAELLHYRNVDASGARIVAEAGGVVIDVPESGHRAMSDVERSLEIVRQCADVGKGWRGILHHLKAIVRILRRV